LCPANASAAHARASHGHDRVLSNRTAFVFAQRGKRRRRERPAMRRRRGLCAAQLMRRNDSVLFSIWKEKLWNGRIFRNNNRWA
jgi:hypothetical protein